MRFGARIFSLLVIAYWQGEMKKSIFFAVTLILTLLLAACNTSVGQPQQPPLPEEMARFETDWMKTSLKLTTAQIPKIDAINLKYARKICVMFEQEPEGDSSLPDKKMNEMVSQKIIEFQSILTPEQLANYDMEMSKRRAGRPFFSG